MKRRIFSLLLLIAMTSVAAAQTPIIGVYGDPLAVSCQTETTQFTQVTVYVCAVLRGPVTGITACEFRIDGLPTESMAVTTYNWNTPLVIGSAGYGIALAFPTPLSGPVAPLGTISFFPLITFPNDWRMDVEPSHSSGYLWVVDLDYNEVEALGDIFTFNCTGGQPYGCNCLYTFWPVATQDATWGQIKALY
jgi:hypothetical protein